MLNMSKILLLSTLFSFTINIITSEAYATDGSNQYRDELSESITSVSRIPQQMNATILFPLDDDENVPVLLFPIPTQSLYRLRDSGQQLNIGLFLDLWPQTTTPTAHTGPSREENRSLGTMSLQFSTSARSPVLANSDQLLVEIGSQSPTGTILSLSLHPSHAFRIELERLRRQLQVHLLAAIDNPDESVSPSTPEQDLRQLVILMHLRFLPLASTQTAANPAQETAGGTRRQEGDERITQATSSTTSFLPNKRRRRE